MFCVRSSGIYVSYNRTAESVHAPSRWSFLRNAFVVLPGALTAVAVIVLNLVFPLSAPAFVASVYDADLSECMTPLLFAAVSAVVAVVMSFYLRALLHALCFCLNLMISV